MNRETLPSLVIAEQLDPAAITNAIEAAEARSKPSLTVRDQLTRQFIIGSLYLDLSLAKDVPPSESEKYAEVAFTHLEEVAESDVETFSKLDSMLLCAYRPAFNRESRSGMRPAPSILQEVRKQLAEDVEERPFCGKYRNLQIARTGLHLLHARNRRLAFPVTAREGQAMYGANAYAHSMYTVDLSGRLEGGKVPFRGIAMPRGRRISQVVRARFGGLAFKALADTYPWPITDDVCEAAKVVVGWLCQEVGGYELNPIEQATMQHMTNKLSLGHKVLLHEARKRHAQATSVRPS